MINPENFRINYILSLKEKLAMPVYSVYADRHLEKSLNFESGTWQNRIIHTVIGIAEALPVIGMIVSIAEYQFYLYSLPRYEFNFSKLPYDMQMQVFASLDPKTSGQCHSVCRHWNIMLKDVDAFQLIELEAILGNKRLSDICQKSGLDPKSSDKKVMIQAIFDDQNQRLRSCQYFFGVIRGLPSQKEVSRMLKRHSPLSLDRFKTIESLIERQASRYNAIMPKGKIIANIYAMKNVLAQFKQRLHRPSKIEVWLSKMTLKNTIKGIRIISLLALTSFAALRNIS